MTNRPLLGPDALPWPGCSCDAPIHNRANAVGAKAHGDGSEIRSAGAAFCSTRVVVVTRSVRSVSILNFAAVRIPLCTISHWFQVQPGYKTFCAGSLNFHAVRTTGPNCSGKETSKRGVVSRLCSGVHHSQPMRGLLPSLPYALSSVLVDGRDTLKARSKTVHVSRCCSAALTDGDWPPRVSPIGPSRSPRPEPRRLCTLSEVVSAALSPSRLRSCWR